MPRVFRGAAAGLAVALAVVTPLAAQGGFGQANRIDSTRYVRTAPPSDPVIQQMWTEGMEHGQAMRLAQVFLDSIGPRLTNSDRFDAGQDWLVKMYDSWGIRAERVQYGTWIKWVRGATHMDLVQPRLRTLAATMLGWSPGTNGRWVEAEAILLPAEATDWSAWAAGARGKFVLASEAQPTCRMPSQVQEYGEPATVARIDSLRAAWRAAYRPRVAFGGNPKQWPREVGVAAMLTNSWSNYPGIEKIFGSPKDADNVPTLNIECEDYNLLYRLADNGQKPVVRLYAHSENLGEQPVHNVIATIPGTEKPDEYIVLSAHYDSWDGGSGATDNGTGTITMFEAARILKKVYPNPKRTIIIGHWGGEEQGLNGSEAWVADNPQIVAKVHAGFNQDNGTGRIVSVSPGPFPAATDALAKYLFELPSAMTGRIRLSGASNGPGRGGTDSSSFQCMKSPVYGLGGVSWDYGSTTWHTNRDTYDKVIAEDLQNNATLVAMLAYMADQDPELLSREVNMPRGQGGAPAEWPSCETGDRNTAASPR